MPVRPILRWPSPILRQPARTVAAIDDAVRRIWDDMIETMEAMPGYGLAATQIGIGLRLAVVDGSTARGQAVRMANPEVLSASEEQRQQEEASPNLPHVAAVILRPAAVTVRFLNEAGAIEERAFAGLWAASAQHQIDHLAGRMYFDHLSPLRRRMLTARSAKLEARG